MPSLKLTEPQRELKSRLRQAIDHEIQMTDDWVDLVLLATLLNETARRIFDGFIQTNSEEDLERLVLECKKRIRADTKRKT